MPTNRRSRTKRPAATPTGEGAFTVSRPDQLQALGDATRWRILGYLLDGPASVQELARALGRAKGTIGHHVRVLERAGLIRLAETRRVRGVVEKRYVRAARQFALPSQMDDLPPGVDRGVLAHLPLRTALAEARSDGPADAPTMSIVVRARMPAARAQRFGQLIEALAAEFADGAPGEGETFGLVAAVYVPDWAVASEAS
ncbi:MAG TPA: winged helix-turn-helix domain-containing protein [Candidatus Limnocylindria bacterium]